MVPGPGTLGSRPVSSYMPEYGEILSGGRAFPSVAAGPDVLFTDARI